MALRPGDTLGGYRLERELGRGGMGSVWRAVDAAGAPRALKVPAPAAGPEELLRFEREALALARVPAHPGVVRVHAAGRAGSTPFCVLELVEGESLAEALRRGPLPPARAAEVVALAARALAHVHAAGVLHRDLKPANILLRLDGTPVLVDFGLARDAAVERLTRSGEVLGTPAYMAPEQAEGRLVDARADVYALGATLYALLVGQAPYEGRSRMALLERALSGPPPRPSALRPEVPAALDAVVLRALAGDPAARFPDALALAEALERRAEAGKRPGGAAVVVAAAVAVVGGLIAAASSPPPAPSESGVTGGSSAGAAAATTPSGSPGASPREEVMERARREAARDGASLRGRCSLIVERLVEDAELHGLELAGEAAGALLAASAADDEGVADLALALDARSPRLLDHAVVPVRVRDPLLRRATAQESELLPALQAFSTALRADPTLAHPRSLAWRASDWGELRDPARDNARTLVGLLVALARADMSAPRPFDDALALDLERELRSHHADRPDDPGVRLALAQFIGGALAKGALDGEAHVEESARLLGSLPDARAPLRLRLRADLLLARLEISAGRNDRAAFHARRALDRGSPVPDLCWGVIVDATRVAAAREPPSSPALGRVIDDARVALQCALERSARTAADDLCRPGLPALDRSETDDERRIPDRRADLARLLAWAGRFDEAKAAVDAARGHDGSHRATFQMLRAIVDLRAGNDDLARRRLADLAQDDLVEARVLVVESLQRAGEGDAAARAARMLAAPSPR